MIKINSSLESLNQLNAKHEDINCVEKLEAFRNVLLKIEKREIAQFV